MRIRDWCCFVFKQKTAYEMRISDWSSDVCSSDLFVNSTKNEPTRSATAPVAQAPVTAAPSYPPPTVAPVTQNRQAALETVIQQRAAAESVNVLGQQVLFSTPSGYCTPGDRKSTRLNSSH